MPDPTFSAEEGRQILARASDRHEAVERARLESGEAMTLEDLTSIADEVGIDVSHVRAAAGELVSLRDSPPPETLLGVPTKVSEVRVLPGTVSDRQWEQMVGVLRQHFGGPGVASRFGEVREWTSPDDPYSFSATVSVRLEPGEDGVVLRLQRDTKVYTKSARDLGIVWGISSIVMSAFLLAGDFQPYLWMIPVALLGAVPLTLLGGRLLGTWSGADGRRRLDTVADKVELIGRSDGT